MVSVLVISALAVALLISPAHGPAPRPDDRTGSVWVNVAGSGGVAAAEDRWGTVETLDRAPTGTLNYHRDVSLVQSPGTESVVIDGFAWVLNRANTTNAPVLRYTPVIGGERWNISFEAFAPNGNDVSGAAPQKFALAACLVNGHGVRSPAVELSYGTAGNTYVCYQDPSRGWVSWSSEVLPALARKGPAEGGLPDRYIVSFCHRDPGTVELRVEHTLAGTVGAASVALPTGFGQPVQLVLSLSSQVDNRMVEPFIYEVFCGGWAVDNLACRGATARYPLIGPSYEYVPESGMVVGETALAGAAGDAEVSIAGAPASFDPARGRYTASVPWSVEWARGYDYTVFLDGVRWDGRLSVTMVPENTHARVAQWWNGWEWASVFGLDDCTGPQSALQCYQDYHHPLTAYVLSVGGSAADVLPTQSEIAVHIPHAWQGGQTRFWDEAVQQASSGQASLASYYPYASRWDNPANGGKGKSFISMANPGNKASYQLMFAQHAAGVRIEGRSSEHAAGAAGNASHIGSWYTDRFGWVSPGAAWTPFSPYDLLDACRGLSWDGFRSWEDAFAQVDEVASGHGVLRVYGHPNRNIAIPELLHWIDDPKSNYSRENWKATDGEVASYLYGRWSTDMRGGYNESTGTLSLQVRTADPVARGYWRVPVTLAVDLEGRDLKDVVVHTGSGIMSKSGGSLKDLDGKRVMDVGYDVRDGVLYVSAIWAGECSLTVTFHSAPSAAVPPAADPVMAVLREELTEP